MTESFGLDGSSFALGNMDRFIELIDLWALNNLVLLEWAIVVLCCCLRRTRVAMRRSRASRNATADFIVYRQLCGLKIPDGGLHAGSGMCRLCEPRDCDESFCTAETVDRADAYAGIPGSLLLELAASSDAAELARAAASALASGGHFAWRYESAVDSVPRAEAACDVPGTVQHASGAAIAAIIGRLPGTHSWQLRRRFNGTCSGGKQPDFALLPGFLAGLLAAAWTGICVNATSNVDCSDSRDRAAAMAKRTAALRQPPAAAASPPCKQSQRGKAIDTTAAHLAEAASFLHDTGLALPFYRAIGIAVCGSDLSVVTLTVERDGKHHHHGHHHDASKSQDAAEPEDTVTWMACMHEYFTAAEAKAEQAAGAGALPPGDGARVRFSHSEWLPYLPSTAADDAPKGLLLLARILLAPAPAALCNTNALAANLPRVLPSSLTLAPSAPVVPLGGGAYGVVYRAAVVQRPRPSAGTASAAQADAQPGGLRRLAAGLPSAAASAASAGPPHGAVIAAVKVPMDAVAEEQLAACAVDGKRSRDAGHDALTPTVRKEVAVMQRLDGAALACGPVLATVASTLLNELQPPLAAAAASLWSWPDSVVRLLGCSSTALVLAPVGVSLYDRLLKLETPAARSAYLRQLLPGMLQALAHCHARGVEHNDVRSMNFIVVDSGEGSCTERLDSESAKPSRVAGFGTATGAGAGAGAGTGVGAGAGPVAGTGAGSLQAGRHTDRHNSERAVLIDFGVSLMTHTSAEGMLQSEAGVTLPVAEQRYFGLRDLLSLARLFQHVAHPAWPHVPRSSDSLPPGADRDATRSLAFVREAFGLPAAGGASAGAAAAHGTVDGTAAAAGAKAARAGTRGLGRVRRRASVSAAAAAAQAAAHR